MLKAVADARLTYCKADWTSEDIGQLQSMKAVKVCVEWMRTCATEQAIEAELLQKRLTSRIHEAFCTTRLALGAAHCASVKCQN